MALSTGDRSSGALRAAQRGTRRAGVAVAGSATVLLGLVLIPLPGPGTLVVLAGLSILGREFPAAKRTAGRIRRTASNLTRRALHRSD